MLAHNDDKYLKFIAIMDRMEVSCCFKWCIDAAWIYSDENKIREMLIETERTKDRTYTDHDIPEKLKMEMSAVSEIV